MKPQQKVWYITGASKGLGLSLVKQLLSAGHKVAATSRSLADLENAVGTDNANFLPLAVDLKDEASVNSSVNAAVSAFGQIDVVVNNAGYGLIGSLEELSDKESRDNFEINVFGMLNVIRNVMPQLRKQRSGHIINISSIGGKATFPLGSLYHGTKFAVEGITEALHQELAPLGIHATVVEPGFFRTDFLDEQSLVKTALELSDYDETVGLMRKHAESANHAQPGDPVKFAEAMLALVNAPKPPQRLALGSDTIARIESKNRLVAQELAEWNELALSTDFKD